MSPRLPILVGTLVAVVMISLPVAAQQERTPWGDPDLQGVYTFATQTPVERPQELAGKAVYTEAELAEAAKRSEAARLAREDRPVDPTKPPGGYDAVWTASERGKLTGRTSLIIDPEDGHVPALTPRAQKIRADIEAEEAARTIGKEVIYNTWADHSLYTRCFARPIPRLGQAYNHGVQILQMPGYVAIHYGSMHDVRIIPLDARPHVDSNIRLLNGDSRGHWEGNTLVVDSTNFSDKERFGPAWLNGDGWEGLPQGNMRFIERFTKVDAKTIEYVVTVEDPTMYTRPWTFVLPWKADDPNYQKPEDLYEFACHEGNYRMMEDALSGSQALKKATGAK
ncbi:MAG TPA: hypothetical protein VLL56_06850 [Terriglobia bacterium]|nr:hypothetical protein [Terriglobia bacterium]